MKPTIEAVKQFPVEVRQISKSEGGGWVAEIPALGRYAFTGWGNTPTEAFDVLYQVAESVIRDYQTEAIELPELEQEIEYSGRFVLRTPKSLHSRLTEEAKTQGVSLNQYILTILSDRLRSERSYRLLEEIHKAVHRDSATKHLDSLNRSLGHAESHWSLSDTMRWRTSNLSYFLETNAETFSTLPILPITEKAKT
jgi:antitoxin HicB